MDAASALADLTEISSQLEEAVLVDGEGAVVASTIADDSGTQRLAGGGLAMLEAAEARFGTGGRAVTQIEASLSEGSIFAARDGNLAIVARTSAAPASGLVLYDLRSCLRTVAEAREKPKPRRRAARKSEPAGA